MEKREVFMRQRVGINRTGFVNRTSERINQMAGLALAGTLSLTSCNTDHDVGHKDDIKSTKSAVWKDAPSAPPWGQKRNASSPFVSWQNDMNGVALFGRSQDETGDVTVNDIFCSLTTDGGTSWTVEKKVDDSALSVGGKINTTTSEDSAALRREVDSTYTLYFHSSWFGNNIYKSKKFDVDKCKATNDKEKFSSAPGYVNDGTLYLSYLTYAPNGFIYASSSVSGEKGIYRVEPDTGKYTLVSLTGLLQFYGQTVWEEGGQWYLGASVNFGCGGVGGYDLCRYSLSSDGLKITDGVNFNKIPGSLAKPNTADNNVTPFVDSKGKLYGANGPDYYFFKINKWDAIAASPDAGPADADAEAEPPTEAGSETASDSGDTEIGTEAGGDASDAAIDVPSDSTKPDGDDADTLETAGDGGTKETGDVEPDAGPTDADAADVPKDTKPATCPVEVKSGDCAVSDCSKIDIPVKILNKKCTFTFQADPRGQPTTVKCTGSGIVSVNRSTRSLIDDKSRGVSCEIADLDKLNSLHAVLLGIEMVVEGTEYGWSHDGEITTLHVKSGRVRLKLNTPDKGVITIILNGGDTLKVKYSSDGKVTPLPAEQDSGPPDSVGIDAFDSGVTEQSPPKEQPSCGPCNTVGGIKADTSEQILGILALAGLGVAAAMRRREAAKPRED